MQNKSASDSLVIHCVFGSCGLRSNRVSSSQAHFLACKCRGIPTLLHPTPIDEVKINPPDNASHVPRLQCLLNRPCNDLIRRRNPQQYPNSEMSCHPTLVVVPHRCQSNSPRSLQCNCHSLVSPQVFIVI